MEGQLDQQVLRTPIRNIGIVAHVDAGKTTLTEQLLYRAGEVRAPGSVDDGTASTDWLSIERNRGISVRSAAAILHQPYGKINLIDTPGHADFAGEVERCLSILDGCILVVSAAEGIQAQTEILWHALSSLHIPTIFFLNKLDRAGSNAAATAAALAAQFSDGAVLCSDVSAEGSRDCSVSFRNRSDPAFMDELTLVLAERDEAIATRFAAGETLSSDRLLSAFDQASMHGDCFPILCGCAAQGVGVDDLLTMIGRCIPPAEREPAAAADLSPAGIVYKVEHDKAMGKVAHIRLYNGSLHNRDTVSLSHRNTRVSASLNAAMDSANIQQKITQIRQVNGSRTIDAGFVQAGDIAALCGLSEAQTGDYFGDPTILSDALRACRLTEPLFRVRVDPVAADELPSLLTALRELADEDPLLGLEWVSEERLMNLQITGAIQLEVLTTLLKERYNLEAIFSPPAVIYKETPTRAGEGFVSYTMPKPCWAVIRFLIEPGPRGSGVSFQSVVGDRDIHYRYQNHIRAALPDAMAQGLYGWEVTDAKVTLTGGEDHVMHTHPLDFFVATPMAMMDGLEHTKTTLLEPMQLARISAEEEQIGRVIGELVAMRAVFDSPVIQKGRFTLEARLPVADSVNFPIQLSILTSGKGILSVRFDGYEPCPPELGKTTIRRGVDPRDHAKWILFARKAIQDKTL